MTVTFENTTEVAHLRIAATVVYNNPTLNIPMRNAWRGLQEHATNVLDDAAQVAERAEATRVAIIERLNRMPSEALLKLLNEMQA